MSFFKVHTYTYLISLLTLLAACSEQDKIGVNTTGQMVNVSFNASLSEINETKTAYDTENHLGLWKREDMVGVIAGYGSGSFTDARMQNFSLDNRCSAGDEFLSSGTFSGKLTNKGSQTYTYYAVYPYTAFQDVTDATSVLCRLEERQYPDLKSWDGACDMLASKPVTVSSSSVATNNLQIQFARLFGMLRLCFGTSITSAHGSEIVETISIESNNSCDKLAGKFTIDLVSTDAPAPMISSTTGEFFNKITLDYRGKYSPLSNIDAYFILNPGTYTNVIITVKTKNHILTLPRNNLTVTRGRVTSASLNWKGDNDVVTTNTPLMPHNPDTLRILTFGHSYVVDSMEYIDDLMNDAGITNATYANLYAGNASISYYNTVSHLPGNTKGGSGIINYHKRYYDGNTVTTLVTQKTIIDAICDEQWDIIVFQTDISHLGFYDYFASDLQKMIDYVKQTCKTEYSKTPLFAWHMFWTFGTKSSYLSEAYYDNQLLNYSAHVQAAKEIIRNKEINLVIPTGTAIQSLRSSSLSNHYSGTSAYEFSRDGFHLDYMAGRYTAACTWFECFLKPCFGKTVLGNNYLPPTTYAGVKVTEDNREVFQRAAILACQNPFEISHLDEIQPTPASTMFSAITDTNW